MPHPDAALGDASAEPRLIKGPHYVDALTFMRRKPRGDRFGGIDHWVVEPTEDGEADREKGHALAAAYLDFIGTYHTVCHGTLLSCIVNDMVLRAVRRGVDPDRPWKALGRIEAAFLHDVNQYAMAAAMIQRMPSSEAGE
jgi:hypothetical protein